MSNDIPGLVETSLNLATVADSDGALTLLTSIRSSVASAMMATRRRIRALAELAGAEVAEELEGYPGWKPNLDSPLLAIFREVRERLVGTDPEPKPSTPASIRRPWEKFPGMDIKISFGPVIEGAHSPDERVEVESVGRLYELLKAMLAELAG